MEENKLAKRYPKLETEQEIRERMCFLIIDKRVDEFRYRLDQGMDPNMRIDGTPILQIASQMSLATCSGKSVEILKLLLEYGADPLATNSDGISAVEQLLIDTEIPSKPASPSFNKRYPNTLSQAI